VIIGGGAIGLLVAGSLARSGAEVALLGRRSTVEALGNTELHISGKDVAFTTRLAVAAEPAELPVAGRQPELAILCVKGYDTPRALPALRDLAPGKVLTLQNGLGNEEMLAREFGAARVIAGAITSSVEPVSADHIIVTKRGGIGLAPLAPGTPTKEWRDAFGSAGFEVRTYADYRALKWSKALLNMLGNASAAILDMPLDTIYTDPRLVAMEQRMILEALAVMRALDLRPVNLPRYPAAALATAMHRLPRVLLFPLLRQLVAGGRGGKDPSLLRDLRAGRARSEGEMLYGAVAQQGKLAGVPTPVNTALWQVLGDVVAGRQDWQEWRGQPERLLGVMGDG
jgi:2-dehydropantoate 2-reductase